MLTLLLSTTASFALQYTFENVDDLERALDVARGYRWPIADLDELRNVVEQIGQVYGGGRRVPAA
jgi:hypothetical protein